MSIKLELYGNTHPAAHDLEPVLSVACIVAISARARATQWGELHGSIRSVITVLTLYIQSQGIPWHVHIRLGINRSLIRCCVTHSLAQRDAHPEQMLDEEVCSLHLKCSEVKGKAHTIHILHTYTAIIDSK